VRHILAGLALAATLALSTTAALAYGDKVEYPGAGLPQNVMAATAPSQVSNSVAAAGAVASPWYWITFRDQNFITAR
jgi:hypothetical protein